MRPVAHTLPRQVRRGEGRFGALRSRALAAAVVAAATALLPVTASAATPPPATARRAGVPKIQTTTVDHPPVDNAVSFDNGTRSQARVALTFDADMTPGMLAQLRAGQVRSWYNQDLRELLDAQHVRSTIFLTGLWTEAYPEVARSLAADPTFELGDHTYDHAAFRTPCYGLAGATDRVAEIARSQDVIAQVTGVRPSLLRFPGDCYDRSDAALAQQQGLRVISGDVRAGDGFNPNAAGIAATVLTQLRPGSIVVMHFHGGPNAPMTAPAVRQIVEVARSRGLEFGTVSEVLAGAAAAPPTRGRDVLASYRSGLLRAPGSSPADTRLDQYRVRRLAAPISPAGSPPESLLA